MPTNNFSRCNEEGSNQLRRGPWTYEEDSLLTHYINSHGEGRWNILANCAGLMRTGKSCRLRWLNYLKPDIKRGNLIPQEQLLILELHSKWGNRWSKIAAHLPGRTDNEIKNYWRTRVQKQARQLKVDSNSKKFLEALRRLWMPRLLEKMEQTSSQSHSSSSFSSTSTIKTQDSETPFTVTNSAPMALTKSTDSMIKSEQPEISDGKNPPINDCYHVDISSFDMESFDQQEMSIIGADEISISDCQMAEIDWTSLDAGGNFWDTDELWEFRK